MIIMISHGGGLVIICFISWSWSRLMSSSSSQSTSSQNCPPFIWRIWAIWYILIFHSCHLGKLLPIGDKYCKSVAKGNLGEIPMQWYFMLQKPKYSGNPKVKFAKDQHFSHISPWKGKVKSSHHDHLHLQGPKRCTTTLIERNISNAFQVEYLETSYMNLWRVLLESIFTYLVYWLCYCEEYCESQNICIYRVTLSATGAPVQNGVWAR